MSDAREQPFEVLDHARPASLNDEVLTLSHATLISQREIAMHPKPAEFIAMILDQAVAQSVHGIVRQLIDKGLVEVRTERDTGSPDHRVSVTLSIVVPKGRRK